MLSPSPLLSHYIQRFARLRRNKHPVYGEALHKPLLLLAVLDEVEQGRIRENRIRLTPELVERFHLYWGFYSATPNRTARLEYPFRHLREEGFWHLLRDGVEAVPDVKRNYSLSGLSREFEGACFSDDLWDLVRDPVARNALRKELRATYFPNQLPAVSETQVAAALALQIQRLKENSYGTFRPTIVREPKEDSYYVRHALFPQVVRALYDESCAVCRLSVRTRAGSGIVDAAHILPFAQFHNDDLRNGIALCKNHHWGFDRGWFAITDDYTVQVSSRLSNERAYLVAGASLKLPADAAHGPAPAALKWHRENIFLG